MNRKKQIFLSIIALIGLIGITVGVTYSMFNYVKEGTKDNTITTGSITFLYTENSSNGRGISLTDSFPISDSQGKSQIGEGKVFDFKVTSTTTKSLIPYEVTIRKNTDSTLSEEAVKIYLTEVEGTNERGLVLDKYSELEDTKVSIPANVVEKTVYKGQVPANMSSYEKNFRLRMWVSEDTDFSNEDMNNKTFKITVNVYSEGVVVTEETSLVYKEEILNGADPVLTDNLIPVKIYENGDVVKANINEEWYSYQNKNWANAVVLKTDTTYENGDTIPENNIESYFVWIPEYSYQLWDLGDYSSLTTVDNTKPHAIPIKFGLANTSDSNTGECTTPGVAGESGDCSVGDYMTHPAFLSFNTNGLWVGKFETGYDGATSTGTAQVNSNDSSKIIIKPNVYSWRNITVGNAFKTSYSYLRNDESHMMKNAEWGAVAYLTNSIYGRCSGTECDEVMINNNTAYVTGYASTIKPTLGYNGGISIEGNRVESKAPTQDGTYTVNYLNSLSDKASSTSNKSGIYDLSGGAWDYVMGYTTGAEEGKDLSELTSIDNDFFTDSNMDKYYDKYTSTDYRQYNNRILGDATGELGTFYNEKDPDGNYRPKSSWYGDYAYFANSSSPWFVRGGHWYSGSGSSSLAFGHSTGGTIANLSFRIVLAPANKEV